MHSESYTRRTVTVTPNYWRVGGMAVILGGIFVKDKSGMRNLLPEPFDVLDHIGNVSPTAQIGCALGILAATWYAKRANQSPRGGTAGRARAIAAAAGLSVGVAASAVIETKTGQKITGWNNQPDIIDFGYGVVGSTLAAVIHNFREEKRSLITSSDDQAEANTSTAQRPFDWKRDAPELAG